MILRGEIPLTFDRIFSSLGFLEVLSEAEVGVVVSSAPVDWHLIMLRFDSMIILIY